MINTSVKLKSNSPKGYPMIPTTNGIKDASYLGDSWSSEKYIGKEQRSTEMRTNSYNGVNVKPSLKRMIKSTGGSR